MESLDQYLQKKKPKKPTILSRVKLASDPLKKHEVAANLKKILQTGKVGHSEKVADLMAQYNQSLGVTKKQHKLGQYLKMADEYYKTQAGITRRNLPHG